MVYKPVISQADFDAALASGRAVAAALLEREKAHIRAFVEGQLEAEGVSRLGRAINPLVLARRLRLLGEAVADFQTSVDVGSTFQLVFGREADLQEVAARKAREEKAKAEKRAALAKRPKYLDPITGAKFREDQLPMVSLFDKYQRDRLVRTS